MNDEIGNTNNATGGTAAPVQEVKEDYSETSSFLGNCRKSPGFRCTSPILINLNPLL